MAQMLMKLNNVKTNPFIKYLNFRRSEAIIRIRRISLNLTKQNTNTQKCFVPELDPPDLDPLAFGYIKPPAFENLKPIIKNQEIK
jgi:hypothetical protein